MSAAQQEVIPASEVRAAEAERVSLLATFAHRYGMEANNMMRTLRATVLRPSANGAEPSNEQVAAFMIVANQHELNPFTKEIHGFVDKRGGIVPIVGVDGWAKLANQHPQFDGVDFVQDDEKCTCTVYRKDRKHPIVVTEYLAECKQPSPAWTSHPKRMLRHRAMVQGYRLAFSFAGVYDPDEGEQVLAAVNTEIDVTPDDALNVPEGTKSKRIGHKQLRETVEAITKATENGDGPGLLKVWDQYDNEQKLYIWGSLRAWERRAFKELEDKARKNHIAPNDIGPWAAELLKTTNDPGAAWKAIEDAYAENDQSPPTDLETIYLDRKRELGIQ